MKCVGTGFVVLIGIILHGMAYCQMPDSSLAEPPLKRNNIFKRAIEAVQRGPANMLEDDTIQIKAEEPFMPYDGKGIRYIFLGKFGFERNFQDTSKGIKYFGTRILNALHTDTRQSIVRNNLFFKEHSRLDAYLLADNERYLRSLEFIQDARILATPVPGQPDSVDITVITKDLFSISPGLSSLSPNKLKGKIKDANLLGMGQKLQLSILADKNRSPGFGYDIQYSKNNIGGSFINGTIGYTTINHNIGNGLQDESGVYIRLEKPLVSAYTRYAGAVSFGQYQTENKFQKEDSLFFKYRYRHYDAWLGYNIGAHKALRNPKNRNRHFVSLRYLNTHFSESPYQRRQPFDITFNSRQAVLGQVTFFQQNSYKTNYIYAFGTTEDVPYGYNVSVVGGWYKQLGLSRPYAGIDANRYIITPKGHIVQYYLRSGGFINSSKLEDLVFLAGTSMFSRIFVCGNVKIRQYLNASYTRQINRVGLYPLTLNNDFGVRNFRADSLLGTQRITLHSETSFFLQPKLFGFKFSPFAFADGSFLSPEGKSFSKSALYYGLGGGLRTRNENMVFGTIQLSLTYFPRQELGTQSFRVGVTTNLRFRYNSNYVKAPDIVQVNSDPENNIY